MLYKLFDEIENNMSVWLVIYLKPGIHSILSHLREGLGIGYFCLNFEHKAYLNESKQFLARVCRSTCVYEIPRLYGPCDVFIWIIVFTCLDLACMRDGTVFFLF